MRGLLFGERAITVTSALLDCTLPADLPAYHYNRMHTRDDEMINDIEIA
jgi:hypothetical protein